MSLAMAYYVVSARRWFKGPRINVEHAHSHAQVLVGQRESDHSAREKEAVNP